MAFDEDDDDDDDAVNRGEAFWSPLGACLPALRTRDLPPRSPQPKKRQRFDDEAAAEVRRRTAVRCGCRKAGPPR